MEPNQKEQIIFALRKAGHVVGYMGDGINDVSALHAADVSLSVAEAVDVAKEAADIVLLEKDLGVLEKGVREGRDDVCEHLEIRLDGDERQLRQYVQYGGRVAVPVLPAAPAHAGLLTNLITDFPEMTIAGDSVDAEMVDTPRRWNLRFIIWYMVVFGLVSSICDYLTFGVLLFGLHANPAQFRTGWFVESVVTASVIVLVIRTRRPFFRSKPSTCRCFIQRCSPSQCRPCPALPAAWPHVRPCSAHAPVPDVSLAVIMLFYVVVTEIAKWLFYRNVHQ